MISYEQYLQFSPYFAQEDIEKEEERLKFLEAIDNLPVIIKNLLISTDATEKVINACGIFELDEFDTEAVSLIVRKIATGEIFIGDATELIASETGLMRDKAKVLLSLLVNEVFGHVLNDIKKIQSAKFPQRIGTAPTQAQTPGEGNLTAEQTNNPNVINLRNRQN